MFSVVALDSRRIDEGHVHAEERIIPLGYGSTMRTEITAPGTKRRFGRAVWMGAMLCGLAMIVPMRAQAPDAAAAPSLRIQILSGKTGRPVTGQHIVLMRDDGGAPKRLADEKTDGEGYAAIPNVDGAAKVSVLVDGQRPCSKIAKRSFELVQVRTAGVVSENTCKPRITLFPQAGTLVVFVREETFFERLRR